MNRMKNLFTLLTLLLWTLVACSNDSAADEKPGSGGTDIPAGNLPMQNVARAIELIDNAVECYFTGTGMAMSRYYNPYTGNRSSELGSVWMYTSSIEAVNAAMKAMKTGQAKGETALYDSHFNRYKELLTQLYDNLEYYAGTFTLTSYTQTKQWTVYGVNRGNDKGAAQVEGILNVYDDQMWLVRELLESYHITGEQRYLEKAEYLMNTCSTVGIALLMNKAIRWEASHGAPGISPSTLVATVPLSARWCGFMKFTKASQTK